MADFQNFKIGSTSYKVKDGRIPAASGSDNGKVLSVNAQGKLVFTTISAGGIQAEVIADVYVEGSPVSPYLRGDVVTYNGDFYECRSSGTKQSPADPSAWTPITLTSIGEWGGNVPGYGYVLKSTTLYHNNSNASQYFTPSSPSQYFDVVNYSEWQATPTASYSVGDYAMYNDELYICTGSTSGPFDPNYWTKINVMSQITPVDASRLCPVANPLTDDRKVVTYDNTEDCYILTKPDPVPEPWVITLTWAGTGTMPQEWGAMSPGARFLMDEIVPVDIDNTSGTWRTIFRVDFPSPRTSQYIQPICLRYSSDRNLAVVFAGAPSQGNYPAIVYATIDNQTKELIVQSVRAIQ